MSSVRVPLSNCEAPRRLRPCLGLGLALVTALVGLSSGLLHKRCAGRPNGAAGQQLFGLPGPGLAKPLRRPLHQSL